MQTDQILKAYSNRSRAKRNINLTSNVSEYIKFELFCKPSISRAFCTMLGMRSEHHKLEVNFSLKCLCFEKYFGIQSQNTNVGS